MPCALYLSANRVMVAIINEVITGNLYYMYVEPRTALWIHHRNIG